MAQTQLVERTKGKPEHPLISGLWGVFGLTGVLVASAFIPGNALLHFLQWLDSGICAQFASHMFYPGGQALPLCARNTGIYLGFTVTLITLHATGRGRVQRYPPWPIIAVLALGVLAMAIDGFNSLDRDLGLFHLYQPNNLIRLATGLATGLALATLTLPALNGLFWNEYNEKRSIASWRSLLWLLPALIVSFFIIASQNAFFLYPIALLGTAGVLTVLGSINLIIITAISKRDQSFTRYRELLPFIAVALALTVGELLGLAQLKFSLLHMVGM